MSREIFFFGVVHKTKHHRTGNTDIINLSPTCFQEP